MQTFKMTITDDDSTLLCKEASIEFTIKDIDGLESVGIDTMALMITKLKEILERQNKN